MANTVRNEVPPFEELPDFGPIAPPVNAKPPSLAEKWAVLPTKWQATIVAVGVTVIGGGSVAFTPRHGDHVVRVVDQQPSPPIAVPVVRTETKEVPKVMPRALMATAILPTDRPLTEVDLTKLFRSVEVGEVPSGAIVDSKTVVGRFVVRPVNAGQIVTGADFALQPLPKPVPEAVHEVSLTKGSETILARYEQWGGQWRLVSNDVIDRRHTPPMKPTR